MRGKSVALVAAALIAAASASAQAGFKPGNAPYGFFGGEKDCAGPKGKTPVVFIHGNANSASDWNALLSDYRAAGFDGCRLYGVAWLSPDQRKNPFGVTHGAVGAKIIADFIEDVKRYSGSEKVDVVAHSMGVTQALAAIDSRGLWPSVRKFVAIEGAMRGLDSCRQSPLTTCSGQLKDDSEKFGFLPADVTPADPLQEANRRMGADGFRALPGKAAATSFYSISDGSDDEILCRAPAAKDCAQGALFSPSPNVAAQLAVATPGGAGAFHHFQIRDMTGPVQRKMLDTDCRETGCAAQ